MNKKPASIPKKCSLERSFFGAVLFSVILVMTACQMGSPTEEEVVSAHEKDEFTTSLSVAASYLDAGRPDKAMHELQVLLEKKPNNIEVLNLMGITQLALNNPNRAILHLEKAWRLKPSAAIGVNLSSAYLEMNRPKDSEKIINISLQRKETPPYAHKERLYHNLGLVAERTGRSILAEKMFRKAIEENPMFHLSHMQLARMSIARKKPQLAIKQLQSARFACPQCYDPLENLVKIYSELGDKKMAQRLVQDYKLTEGISIQDRRRISDLEHQIIADRQHENQDAPTKNR